MSNQNSNYKMYLNLKRIERKTGEHTELISLYVSYKRSLKDAVDYLKNEQNESENIKSKSNRTSVLTALDRIIHYFKHCEPSTSGYCIFASADQIYPFIPPQPNTLNRYTCGKTYVLDELKKLLTNTVKRYGLVVLDGSECTIASLEGKKMHVLYELESSVSSRTIKGGQSARRYRNARKQSLYHYYSEVSDLLNTAFDNNVETIFYGGILPASQQYLKMKPGLLPWVADKLTKCYPVPYADKMGLRCLFLKITADLTDMAYEKGLKERLVVEELVAKNLMCTLTHSGLTTILINEDRLLDLELTDTVLDYVNVKVCEVDTPLYAYLHDCFNGILYLKRQ